MADIIIDGMVRVTWATAVANVAAPTTTELNAGMALEGTLTPDGLRGFQADTASVDTSSLVSTFNTSLPGRESFANMGLMLKRQTATDTIYNTLQKGTAGFVVIRRGITATTAWASAQAVEVYPVVCGREQHQDPEANSLWRYLVPLMLSAAPNLRAAVA